MRVQLEIRFHRLGRHVIISTGYQQQRSAITILKIHRCCRVWIKVGERSLKRIRMDVSPPVGGRLAACTAVTRLSNQDLYFDGQLTRPQNHIEGATSISDLRLGPIAEIRDPFHNLVFYLPRTALDSFPDAAGARRPLDLRHTGT